MTGVRMEVLRNLKDVPIGSCLLKAFVILLIAFSTFVIIKYFKAFSSVAQVTMDEVTEELDAVRFDRYFHSDQPQSKGAYYLRSFLLIALMFGKIVVMGTVMFVSFFIVEAHGLLPTSVLCFLYGVGTGFVVSYLWRSGFFRTNINRKQPIKRRHVIGKLRITSDIQAAEQA